MLFYPLLYLSTSVLRSLRPETSCNAYCNQLFFFLSFGHATKHTGSYYPDQGSSSWPLHWKHRVLTTGPQGSLNCFQSPNFEHTVAPGPGCWRKRMSAPRTWSLYSEIFSFVPNPLVIFWISSLTHVLTKSF